MQDVQRLEKRIIRATAQAIQDFGLVVEGDRILVGCSGGKDSYTLLHVLMRLRERAPIDFELVAVNLDQGQPGFPAEVVEGHFKAVGVPNFKICVRFKGPRPHRCKKQQKPHKAPKILCGCLKLPQAPPKMFNASNY